VTDPPSGFAEHALPSGWALPLAALVVVLAFALRAQPITIAFVAVGVTVTALLAGSDVQLGPSALSVPTLDLATLATAFTVLVLPQVPLSFANSCLATADAARVYFGEAAQRVRPGRLATTFGSANLLAGAVSGMPVCHGAGGLTAHVAFGARTGGAPVAMGIALLTLAVGLGAGLASLLAAFPLPILAGVLATAGILHIGLLRDLHTAGDWALALAVGAVGFTTDLATALLLGLAVWWLPRGAVRLRTAAAS
jgi:sulfate permease, SulP family